MNKLDKYLDYLRKEFKKKKERKSDIDKLIVDAKSLRETLINNINLVNEEKLRNIFEKINEKLNFPNCLKLFLSYVIL